MKKSVFACAAVLLACFFTAVALCVRAIHAAEVSAFDTQMRIVVDAGHGGIDGGVTGRKTGVKESDLNLAIAFRVRDTLTEMGFEVVMTRRTEAGLYDAATRGFKKRDMQRRKEIIQAANPALVVSVHQNFYPSKMQRGAQVFYGKEVGRQGENGISSAENSVFTGRENAAFAACVQRNLNDLYGEVGVKGRSASEADFFILRCAEVPSVLVECGFLSNAADEALLVDAVWQQKIAHAVAAGAAAYLMGAA